MRISIHLITFIIFIKYIFLHYNILVRTLRVRTNSITVDTCITVYYAHEGLHYNHAYVQYYVISIMCVIGILIVSHINLF